MVFSYSCTADENDNAIDLPQLLLRKAMGNELRRKLGQLERPVGSGRLGSERIWRPLVDNSIQVTKPKKNRFHQFY